MSKIEEIEDLINKARYLEAHALSQRIMESNGYDKRVKQLHGLAAAKAGAVEEAEEHLLAIHREDASDSETAGILGGIYKNIFRTNKDPKFGIKSRDMYLKNYELTGSHYTGINAASLSLMCGDSRKGKQIANELIEKLESKEKDFWETATLAEAYLLIKKTETAADLFVKVSKMAGTNWGWRVTISNQLWLLKHFFGVPSRIISLFDPPAVVAFVGHMVDAPGSTRFRFPQSIVEDIKINIKSEIQRLNAQIGFCSLACGADILFAEAMLEVGAELNVFLPFEKEDFLNVSVRFAGSEWEERFHNVASKVNLKYVTEEKYFGDDFLFEFLGKIIFGAANMRSEQMHSNSFLLSVLSKSDLQRRDGGTKKLTENWYNQSNWYNINCDILAFPKENEKAQVASPVASIYTPPKKDFTRELLNIVYIYPESHVDQSVVDKLKDEIQGMFLMPRLIDQFEGGIIGFFVSFINAVEFAFFVKEYFKTHGTPIDVKIGIHVGPVHVFNGKEIDLWSNEVSKTVSIINKVPSHLVYVTETFAALLALDNSAYITHYVGKLDIENDNSGLDIFSLLDNTENEEELK